jgi:hypothetical protein
VASEDMKRDREIWMIDILSISGAESPSSQNISRR